ncbi:MAG TPA: class I SAM-dependent methyltransferase [Gallionellaceae bacterium]|nr:class I SAM-dependent methyltransferase [Gallionellaceae bacterium]
MGHYDTLFGRDEQELRRLQLLGEIFDSATIAQVRALDIGPGSRCLEVGAGAGSVAKLICNLVTPSPVIATDISIDALDSVDAPNLQRIRHDVTTDQFPEGTFDLIHARFVLSHIRTRDDVMRRMASWLAPGGWLFIESFNWFPIDSSTNPEYLLVMKAWESLIRETIGTDARWSRSYPKDFTDIGLVDVGATVNVNYINGGSSLAKFWQLTLKTSREKLINGYVTAEQFDRTLLLFNDPTFWDIAPAIIQGWGRRPLI